jgi:transcriptional regulator of acetoin/glycerol metabolism
MEAAMEQAGREYLTSLMRRVQGNVTRAAEEAGLERESLHRLLRRHGLEAARFRVG